VTWFSAIPGSNRGDSSSSSSSCGRIRRWMRRRCAVVGTGPSWRSEAKQAVVPRRRRSRSPFLRNVRRVWGVPTGNYPKGIGMEGGREGGDEKI
jgi:hypothetical protein